MILERLNWVMMSYLEFSPCHRVIMTALKPGWVIQVIQVRPGLKIIWVWPRLDHVSHKIKKVQYGSNICFVSHTHFSKQWFCLLQMHPPFIFVHMHATIAIYSLLRAMPVTVAGAPPLQYAKAKIFTYSLHEATSIYTSHVFVSGNLWVASPTNPSW